MRHKRWIIGKLDDGVSVLAQKEGVSPFLAQILLNRNVSPRQFKEFLAPDVSQLHSAMLLPDMAKAVGRIKDAVASGEHIFVFGDYDVDGITSLAIFHEYIKAHQSNFSFYIPHRVKEGYGLNKEAIAQAKEEKATLFIAFDCGTNALEEVQFAKACGMDIIVVDHHHPKSPFREPFAFINPKREDSSYPFSELSSAALSFKLLQALTGQDCYQHLDLVALSLVCDVVPLRGENRTLLKKGITVLRESSRPSIKALCKVAKLKQHTIDTFHVGFILGPRINASGRVAYAHDALDIFLCDDLLVAEELAHKLTEYNLLRRGIESNILKEAEAALSRGSAHRHAIVVAGQKWHPGVLGIVASRLADKYYRPAFVISFDQERGVGSARSIRSIHLMETLAQCAGSLHEYGGHRKAAGIQIFKEEFELFKEQVDYVIRKNASPQDFIPVQEIEFALSLADIDLGFVEELEKLLPFGEENARPLFVTRSVFKKASPSKVRSGYCVWLSDGARTLEAAVYDKDVLEIMRYAQTFDIVYSIDRNTYHNSPRLTVRDCRLSGNEETQ